jgi:hypothetical protein
MPPSGVAEAVAHQEITSTKAKKEEEVVALRG